jgi:lipoate-protein ligase A
MIFSDKLNNNLNKETMNIEEKAKEILRSKLTDIDLECYLKGSPLTYSACLEAVKEAINYTHSSLELKDKKAFTFEEYVYFFYTENSGKYFNKETQVFMSLEEIEQKYNWHIRRL